MIKKSFRLMLLAAFALSSVMFVSCNKWEDEINELDSKVAALEQTVSSLKAAVDGGAVISSVSNTSEGVKFTLSNGQSYTVNHGAVGATGATGAAGQDGKDGKPGSVVTIGENGNWFIDGEDQNVSAVGASTFVVDCGSYFELNVVEKVDGENSEIVKINLPKTKAITSLQAAEIYSGYITPGSYSPADIEIYYGETLAKDVKFNNVTYKKGTTLTSASSTLYAVVNPADADAALYNFALVDSKGNTPFVISKVEPYTSEKPLTRAATANNGVWKMTVAYANNSFDGDDVADRNGVVYSLTTETFNGTISSGYDVRVDETKVTNPSVVVSNVKDAKKRTIDLSKAIDDLDVVVDYYFELADKTQATAMGANLDGKTLTAAKNGNVDLTVYYLLVDGNSYEESLVATFEYIAPSGALTDVAWTVNSKTAKVYLPMDAVKASLIGASDSDIPSVSAISYTWADGTALDKATVKVNGTKYGKDGAAIQNSWIVKNIASTPKVYNAKTKAYDNADDINKEMFVEFEFDYTVAMPGEYMVTLAFRKVGATNNTIEVPVKVSVVAPDQAIVKYDNYFNGNNAVAYGTANGIAATYDLTQLFKTTGLSFAETTVKDANGNAYTEWLSGSVVTVPVYDYDAKDHNTTVYATREYTASIIPFDNNHIEATTFAFNLTVKSAIKEGSFTTSAAKTIETSTPVKFAVTDFAGVDVFGDKFYIGKVYDKDSKGNYLATTVAEKDSRIQTVEVVAADDNAKNYLEIGQFTAKGTDAADAFSVSRKSSVTSLVVDTECKVKVVITDVWGMESEATVTVTLKAFGN